MNIYNERDLCYFKTKIETYRRKTKATICFNCSGYYHAARNCHLRTKCIKCGGEHATWDCSIKKEIAEPKCVNFGETGHLAAWKGCKTLPVIKKPSTRQRGKIYAQAAADNMKNVEQTGEKQTEAKTDEVTDLTDLKDSLQELKEVKMLLQARSGRHWRQAKTKQEPTGVVSPKLSRILLEKGAVPHPPRG
ncbi:hypothetical protein AVEN_3492-1 [Araneus ventricosus]|uniref:Pre-C2HC domain-containing protein n=1 Tax=Araneus ventricosus TaxID=182803 RepID=A0A4Y2PY01_ARAVE|nr:hypothetical protein AVEN_3492-1 [Araneus ventricosus]